MSEIVIVNASSGRAACFAVKEGAGWISAYETACIHSRDAAQVSISLRDGLLEVANGGDAPLDATRIFERFYQGSKKEGSTGLGLALVRAVAGYYGMDLSYGFSGGMHRFRVRFSQP